jgi:nitroreductase
MEKRMSQQPSPEAETSPPVNAAAFDFLAHRMSYPAKMLTGPVPGRDALAPILTAALRVPDHGKLEPWRLVVVEPAAMAAVADIAEARARELAVEPLLLEKARGQFDRSQLAVVVVACPCVSDKAPLIEQTLSAGALCLSLVNAAMAAGWGACWLSGWISHDPVFAERAFGCAGGEWIAGIIHIGTPGPTVKDRPRPDLGQRVSWLQK